MYNANNVAMHNAIKLAIKCGNRDMCLSKNAILF